MEKNKQGRKRLGTKGRNSVGDAKLLMNILTPEPSEYKHNPGPCHNVRSRTHRLPHPCEPENPAEACLVHEFRHNKQI